MKGKYGKLENDILYERIDRDKQCRRLEGEIENLKMTLADAEKWHRVATVAISLLSYTIVAVVTFVILYITKR